MRCFLSVCLGLCIIGGLLTTGCANLKEKGVAIGGSVQGFKITTSVDPESGAVMPEVATGFGDFIYLDVPVDGTTDLEYFHMEKSLWSSVTGSVMYVRMRGRDACSKDCPGAVKITVEPLGDVHPVTPPALKVPK